MPRKPRYTIALDSSTARLALPIRKKFYSIRISLGVRLAYRRNNGPGTWTVLTRGWSKRFGLADDFEPTNHSSVLSFDEAVDTARKLARGDDVGEVEGGRPATVAESVETYRRDLVARGGDPGNASRVAFHLPTTLKDKPVSLLVAPNVRGFRDLLVEKKLSPATVNRTVKALVAALNLAAKDDPQRIRNTNAWQLDGLRDSAKARLMIIPDDAVARVVKAAYEISYRFGLLVEVLAVFGCRASQARRILVGDLEADRDVLQMPGSLKGKGKRHIIREPLPVPPDLARRLAAEAAGRDDSEPLLRDDLGNAWDEGDHADLWERAAAAAKLPKKPKPKKPPKRGVRHAHITSYCLRHSSIARSLLRALPAGLCARAHDTSEGEIRKHYGRFIARTDTASDMLRATQLSFGGPAPASNVVVPLSKVAKPKGWA